MEHNEATAHIMKTQIVSVLICWAVFGANLSFAQSNGLSEATHWGESVQGVQLSISMTNRVVKTPLSTAITAVTRNSSTNDIRVQISFPMEFFDVVFTNDAGKSYDVITPSLIRGLREFGALKPGEQRSDSIPLTFSEDIEPGDYTLKATRSFTLKGQEFPLVSNSLKVRIVK